MTRNTRSRRGVLLLVVLSMLVIFMLIAITFVVVSNQQRTAARAVARTAQKESRPSDLLDEAMYQLLRDTKNPASAVRGHSLLRDMYGPDGFVTHLLWMPDHGKLGFPPNTATEIPDQTGGQLIDLFVYDDPTVATDVLNTDGHPYRLNRTAGYYNGRVLTVAGGSFSGASTRIVDYAYDSSNDVGRFRVLSFENSEGRTVSRRDLLHKANLNKLPTKKQYDPTLNVQLIVNGHPFNGSGTGYNRVTGRGDLPLFLRGPDGEWGNAGIDDDGDTVVDNLTEAGWNPSDDIAVTNVPAALAPNRTDIAGGGVPPVVDSSDESYDAPDYQNMALAAIVPIDNQPDYVLPSFHRPALINYWATQQPAVFNDPALRPFFLMRPLHGTDADVDGLWDMPEPYEDTNANRVWDATEPYVDVNQNGNYDAGEPDFTGKHSNLWTGPWDVDNDGDGVEDSIWIDLGMPAQPGQDGRMVKPLFAILCVDLDGRVNLNAHGTLPRRDALGNIMIPTANIPGPYANNSGTIPPQPLGQGFGPADINPSFLGALSGNLDQLLKGSNPPGGRIDGRYGSIAGDPNDVVGTLSGEIRNRIDFARLTFPNPPNPFGFFGRLPDIHGLGMLALDHGGYPLAVSMGLDHISELRDNPYEIDLSRNAPRPGRRAAPDANPFTLHDLERLVRIFDKDAGALSSRLTGLLPSLVSARLKVTTDSYDTPTASFLMGDNSFYILGPDGQPGQGGVDDDGDGQIDNPEETGWPRGATNPSADDFQSIMARPPVNLAVVDLLEYRLRVNNVSAVDTEIQKMLSPDLLAGLRMDINRAVGNGWDDNGNGAVDDPQEAYAPGNQVDDDQDGTVDEADEMFPVDRNGLDDDRDGTRDEAGEMPANALLRGETAWNPVAETSPLPAGFLDVPLDHNNDGFFNKADTFARQALARHLFVLMMLVRDEAYFDWQQNETPALSNTDKQDLTIRRIAQWAVNVVDFRDPDAIMTPFEYDLNPFNGWSVDGDPDTPDGSPNRRVVWGCEHPELLLTETLAFHDRRVKDSAYDRGPGKTYGTGMNDDPDWDQPRIPQGSAFFELYCARGPRETSLPAELYELIDIGGGNLRWHLDLGRLAPPRNVDSNPYPVWRLAISGPTTAPNTGNNVLGIAEARPESTSFEVNDLRLLSPAAPPTADERVNIERIVWFSNNSPVQGGAGVGTYQWQRIYYRRSPNRLLQAGRYAVIGPWRGNAGHRTVIGSRNTSPWAPSTHEVSVYPTVNATDNSGGTKYNYPNTATEIQPALGMVVAANPPATFPRPIGVSISEPLPTGSYYPAPTHPNDAYGDLTEASADPLDRYRDKPLDSDTNATPLRPLAAEGKLGTGTTPNHKTVFLQRLANPVLPWNPPPLLPDGVTPHPAHDPSHPVNPYRTVDWMPIDLTVFNGEDGTGATDPDDPNPDDAAMPVRFSSRQRGTNGQLTFNVWSNWTETNGIDPEDVGPRHNSEKPKDTGPDPGVPFYFQHNLIHTLGYLNDTYGTIPATRPPNPMVPVNMRDFVQTNLDLPPSDAEYFGSPKRPFPWLAWFNRPYTNPMQVMLVPATSQARLLHEFTIGTAVDPYDAPGGSEVTFRTPYGHLLNFLHFETGGVLEGPHFYRILELLRTRSPFVGTDTLLSPAVFANAGNGRSGLHPPFNKVSQYRDPGRVNVNTIYSQEIWEAIRNGHALPFYGGVFQSRRGFNNGSGILNTLLPTNDVLLARDTVPTFFANPFRAPGAGHLVPLPGVAEMDRENIDVYLTRSAGAAGGPPTGQPLLAFPALQQLTADYNNAQRNAYFRYAGMQRLSNLLTTRSNVYAVWITVGYFEVEAVPQRSMTVQEYQQRYPDGYRLVGEVGGESGDVERHRAFYIIDRSIPVAFEPGKNHNVDQAVRLRRFIE